VTFKKICLENEKKCLNFRQDSRSSTHKYSNWKTKTSGCFIGIERNDGLVSRALSLAGGTRFESVLINGCRNEKYFLFFQFL
jgi:hypothetical protein